MAELTREAVDWFFNLSGIECFRNMKRAKVMCDMRLRGHTYTEIGEVLGISSSYAYETISRVLMRWNKHQAAPKQPPKEFTQYEINQIKSKYKTTAVEEIAKGLRKPVREVEKQIAQMLADGVIANYNRELNPNPVTKTTRLLVCRYYQDNLDKGMTEEAAKYNIASELSRTYETICSILEECKADGTYEIYNQYGR